jgi:hypothetical protein
VAEAFEAAGIEYRASSRDRSAIYADVLPLFTSGKLRLLDAARMAAQFAGLERRTGTGGRDRIDHGPSGHDDICLSVSGALTLAVRADAAVAMADPLITRISRAEALGFGAGATQASWESAHGVRRRDWSGGGLNDEWSRNY